MAYGSEESLRKFYAKLLTEQKSITEKVASTRKGRDLNLNQDLPDSIEDVFDLIRGVLFDLELLIVNGEVDQEVIVGPEQGFEERAHVQARVYIGGNKLSRGLTLPGLCVSMFIRQVSMYDTLLQMGRWFGYRDGYVDLCRICTTPLVISNFQGIVEAVEDFESQIDQMNSDRRTPENFRLTILQHPGLLITARNKMRTAAEAVISFNGRTLEQREFDLDEEQIHENVAAARLLLAQVQKQGRLAYASKGYPQPQTAEDSDWISAIGSRPSGRVWKNVPAAVILQFLKGYSGLVGGASIEQQGMTSYIRDMNAKGELTSWTVFVPGSPCIGKFGTNGVVRQMLGESNSTEQVALKALKTGSHEYVGVSDDVIAASGISDESEEALARDGFKKLRREAGRLHPEEGHFILYLIQSKQMQDHPALKFPSGEVLPIVSYYMWVPASGNSSSMTMGQFNSTVHDVEEAEENVGEDEEEA